MDLTFVTSHDGKVEETRDILDVGIRKKEIDIDEIQAISVEEVVRHKAKKAYAIAGEPVIVDDTGLYLEQWNGFPGALAKWLLVSTGPSFFCSIVDDNPNAVAETIIGLGTEEGVRTFTGSVEGVIPTEPRGDGGIGWDPVFVPNGYERTFAELGSEIKNEISMRKLALHELKTYLEVERDV